MYIISIYMYIISKLIYNLTVTGKFNNFNNILFRLGFEYLRKESLIFKEGLRYMIIHISYR
jgi:hypothetical protein